MTSLTDDLFSQLSGPALQQISQQLGTGQTQTAGAVAAALPLLIAVPLLAELMQLPRAQLPILMMSLLLGTPLLSLIGAVVAALTVSMPRAGILLALLALPLYVPVLVFGAGAVAADAQGLDASGALLMMGAGLAAGVVLAPLAAAAGLRIALIGE